MKKLLVLAFAALLLIAYSVPVMAEVKIGGIIFTDFYYLNRDKENAKLYGQGDGRTSYTNTMIEVPSITRLYARWTNEDNVGMYIEFGLVGANGSTAVSVRHAYGWWDVSPMFQLMAGHSTTPFSPLNPSQLLGTQDGSLNIIGVGYGEYYSGRFPQIRGTFNFGKAFQLAVALVDENGGARFTDQIPPPATAADFQNNSVLPRLDIGANIEAGPVSIKPSVLFQRKSVDNIATPGSPASQLGDSVNTWAGSLGIKFGMGPFMAEAEGNYGQNLGNSFGLIGTSPSATHAGITTYRANTSSNYMLDDTTTFGYWLDLAYKFGPVTPHFIFGQQQSSGDNNPMSYRTTMIGVSVPIQLAKGFSVRPELMWYDDGDSNTTYNSTTATQGKENDGSYAVYGVQFQITF